MTAAGRRRRELDRLFKETVSLYWRFTADASRIHGRGDVSGPRRTILMALAEAGPQTVSRLARARGQARQRIQPLMNALIRGGLVHAAANPMHRQSPLMVLTASGLAHVEEIRSREGALLERLSLQVPAARLRDAARVLEAVRTTLEQQLPALLAASAAGRRRRVLFGDAADYADGLACVDSGAPGRDRTRRSGPQGSAWRCAEPPPRPWSDGRRR